IRLTMSAASRPSRSIIRKGTNIRAPVSVKSGQLMQRNVNGSESDYHYRQKKNKRNVGISMTKCKSCEVE
ncbi:hypothetical protein QCE80_13810, partial [Staphylococcus aureus]|nr:hypothetical protein [Staphylococcus aureus]